MLACISCIVTLWKKNPTTTVGTITINVRAANPEKAAHARHVTSGPVGTERERERERERQRQRQSVLYLHGPWFVPGRPPDTGVTEGVFAVWS